MVNNRLFNKYSTWQEDFKPLKENFHLLIIAESPPYPKKYWSITEHQILPNVELINCNIPYLYNPEIYQNEILLESLALFFLHELPPTEIKEQILWKTSILKTLQSEGIFLIDAITWPINDLNSLDRDKLINNYWSKEENITQRLEGIPKETPIILIKNNIFKIRDTLLKLNYNVLNNQPICFPSYSLPKFLRQMVEILKGTDLKYNQKWH